MDWTFLLPWAADIARVVTYAAREEVDYGTLHDRVDFVSLQLADLDAFADQQTHDERWEELTCLREGLELLALAVHYDKHAWQFFHDHSWAPQLEAMFPFEVEHPHVQSHWQLCFHDATRNRSDSTTALRAGVDMLTRMPKDILTIEYHKAKRRMRELVGPAWNEAYRVPVSLSFTAPAIEEDPTRWLSVVDELVRSLNDPTGSAGDCLRLGPIVLSLEKLPMMDFTNELLLTMMNAYAHVPQLTLALQYNDIASVAPTINDAVAICPVGTEPDDRFVDMLVLTGSSGALQFAGLCSAVARAKTLGGVTLVNAFADHTPVDRRLQWRWLGYALSNRHWTTSVRHLKIQEEFLTCDDVEQLIKRNYPDSESKNPPASALDEQPRTVQIAAKSLVCLASGETEPLERLGWTDADEFLVLGDDDDGEWMHVLVPGYGRCQVSCTSVIGSRVLEPANAQLRGKPRLLSLNLHLTRFEPDALPRLTEHFGATLTKLSITMKQDVTLDEIQVRRIFWNCPALRFLSFRCVHIGSMDVLLDAYRANECRLESLSLWNVWVDAASLTRFAFELADKQSVVNRHLREFRFNYDDIDDDELRLPDENGITAFTTMLAHNQTLTFFETALEGELHAQYADRFLALDGAMKVAAIPIAVQRAFLAVVTYRNPAKPAPHAPTSSRKKQRCSNAYRIPSKSRADLVKRIWSFLSPVETITRTVSATRINLEM